MCNTCKNFPNRQSGNIQHNIFLFLCLWIPLSCRLFLRTIHACLFQPFPYYSGYSHGFCIDCVKSNGAWKFVAAYKNLPIKIQPIETNAADKRNRCTRPRPRLSSLGRLLSQTSWFVSLAFQLLVILSLSPSFSLSLSHTLCLPSLSMCLWHCRSSSHYLFSLPA